MKSIYIMPMLIVLPILGAAQVSIERQVLSTSGSSYTDVAIQVDYTLGEPIITTASTPDLILTQGFHQSNITLVGINRPNGIEWEVRHFPNPTSSQLSVKVDGEITGTLTLKVMDAKGRIVFHEEVEKGFGTLNHQIWVNQWADGMYFMQIQQGDQPPVSLPFQKIH